MTRNPQPTIIAASDDEDVYLILPCYSSDGLSGWSSEPVVAWQVEGDQLIPVTEYEDSFDPDYTYALQYGEDGPYKFPDGEVCTGNKALFVSLKRRGMKGTKRTVQS